MNFDDLDDKMRVFETAHDHCVMPGVNIVVRLDGRSFTRLTKDTELPELGRLIAPFDPRFNLLMNETVNHLMSETGFRVIYGFTQSDEISLLLHPQDELFNRKERKLNSVLAGEASAFLSRRLQHHAVFDSRVCQLPTEQLVVDYFRWRQEDAARNALSSHCFYALLGTGLTPEKAHQALMGATTAMKNELLFSHGTNFDALPLWQRHGCGTYWVSETVPGYNPKLDVATETTRRSLYLVMALSRGPEYGEFIRQLHRDALFRPEG